MPRSHRPWLTAATLATAATALASCSTADAGDVASDGASTSAVPAAASASPAAAWPVTIDNCGFDVTVASEPQRIVSIKSTTTELLLALGLEDKIVGAAFLDGPLEPGPDGQVPDVPVISDFLPNQEAVAALEPDLIVGGWESNFSADGVGEREALAERGVASYVAPSACKEPGYQPEPMTFELLFDQIAEAGELLGTQEAATQLSDSMREDLAAITPDSRGLTALWYSSGSDSPYVGAGIGAPQMMMDAAGLTNVAGDVHDTWTSLTWEAVVAADPDVIVLVDASWNTAASKIEALEANPATSSLSAVTGHRYVTIPFPAAEAGVRSVAATQSIVDQLAQIDVP